MVDLNARLAVVESKQITQEAHNLKIEKKVDDMHDVIMQLRGAKWFGWFIAAALGFLVSNVATIANYLQGK